MHTFQYDEFTANHNGDYSGDVVISFPHDLKADGNMPVVENYINKRLGIDKYEVRLPFELLRALVFDYMRGKMIRSIEESTDDDFEKIFTD